MYKTISLNKKLEAPNHKLNLINGILIRKKSLYRVVKGFLQFLYKIYRGLVRPRNELIDLVQLWRNDIRNGFHMLLIKRALAEDHFQVFLEDHFFLQ